jgi:sodium/potassium-transporting ATPase subunit alpha
LDLIDICKIRLAGLFLPVFFILIIRLQNKMFVTDCLVDTTTFIVESARHEKSLKEEEAGTLQLRAVAGLCNAAEFDAASAKLPLHERSIYGDATDQAILRLSESLGPVADLRQMWKKTYELAFNSKNKFMIKTFSLAEPEGLDLALSPAEAKEFKQDVYVMMQT